MGTIRPPCFFVVAGKQHACCVLSAETTNPCPGVRFPELVTAIEMSGSESSEIL
jgi:hypothetical protein